MSQYSASTLNVTANYMGEQIPCQIQNISWNGNNFTGSLDGISIHGTDNNGSVSASGTYWGHNYNATGSVTSWS